jgi:hypothetical protein
MAITPSRADNKTTHGGRAGFFQGKGVGVYRFFHSERGERGSIASEFTFGAMLASILVIGGLWVIAQLEGVSFQVLIQQLRDSR